MGPLIIVLALVAVAIFFALQYHKKLVAEGTIISRRTNFMENAEEFTLVAVDPAQVTEAVKALDYGSMRTHMQGNSEQQWYRFEGASWKAALRKVSEGEGQMVYRFEFTNWKTHNGSVQDSLSMNKLMTAVEKIFLGFDPNTQVQEIPLELKTKRHFF